ncbi:hypothetical protein HKCCE4037_06525 [Rhodobacterales bacterium HKCCE4037]|nr:hypothetical protein [Rhodobacterales bacterium HKCCE4037]
MTTFTERTANDPAGNPAFLAPARAFLVWRAGTSVDWACTVAELAEATGLTSDQVRPICRRRGWPVERDEPGGGSGHGRAPVDSAMNDVTGRMGARA